jgi:hypothetical protein
VRNLLFAGSHDAAYKQQVPHRCAARNDIAKLMVGVTEQ